MARDPDKAISLKNQGNDHFKRGEYMSAESLYSKAIIADDTNPALYTNRAFTRLKMKLWDSAIADCESCLKLNDESVKAHYYLAQAHLELNNFNEAVVHAQLARELAVCSDDKSLPQATSLVLATKKARWEDKEKRRTRSYQELECEAIELMEKERDRMLENIPNDGNLENECEKNAIMEEWDQKIKDLRTVFDKSRVKDEQYREVPSWAIDEISFNIMVDPVMSKSGKSYERSSITEAIKRKPLDPITRTPLYLADLQPNLNLKEACEKFLDENGWAVDW